MTVKFIYFLAIFTVLCACNSENKERFKKPSEILQVNSQYFNVSTKIDTVIVGKKGTRVNVFSESFDALDDSIRIELKEYYSFPDMVIGGLNSVSNGRILETDGMIYLDAVSLSGKSLGSKLNKQWVVQLPLTNQEMKLFYGKYRGEELNWEISDESPKNETVPTLVADSLPTDYALRTLYNTFPVNRLGWINSDKFMEIENKTDLIVKLSKIQQGARYSAVFHNYNSILSETANDKGELIFIGIPSGEKITLIGIGAKDNILFYSDLDMTTDSKNATLPLLKEISKEDLRSELETKFGNNLAYRPKLK
jgi:hypothetical protein